MSESTKKAGLIVIAIVAIVAAIFGAMRAMNTDKMQVEKVVPMPAGYKSEKQAAVDAQGGGGKGGASRDLGGPIGGQ